MKSPIGKPCCECGFIIQEGQPVTNSHWGWAHDLCLLQAEALGGL